MLQATDIEGRNKARKNGVRVKGQSKVLALTAPVLL